jgi:5,6,7,8-tetrahydromethanopterin hydro-lyase
MARTLSVGESLVGDGNEVAKPDTIIANKVTIKGEKQVGHMFGPAQAAVARGVVDSVRDGVIPEGDVDNLCVIVGVFIHWLAEDEKKIFDWNYEATKESIARAMAGEPAASSVIAQEAEARHPFAAGAEA